MGRGEHSCFCASAVTVYVRVYRYMRGVPRGLYRIASQDKDRRTLVLERVNALPFLKQFSCEAFEMMLLNGWADISLAPL